MVVKTSCYLFFFSCCNNPPHMLFLLLLLLLLLLPLSFHLLPLRLAHAQNSEDNSTAGWSPYSTNPSVDGPWPLSDYYNTSDEKFQYKYSNFTISANISNLILLNDEQSLYGRCLPIYSAHVLATSPYTVYFRLCFVIPIAGVCQRKEDPTIAAYQLSVVAVNSNGKVQDQNMGQVIWTANTERLVNENACLHLGEDSNLKLMENEEVVWETNTTGLAVNASLIFSYEGNLMLVSNTNHQNPAYTTLWQSFGCPTDTLMVLQVLQKPKTLRSRYLSVPNSSESSGSSAANYTMVIGDAGLQLYARLWKQDENPYGSLYWVSSNRSSMDSDSTAAAHDGISFGALCWASGNQLEISVGSNRASDFTAISPANCSSIMSNAQVMLNTTDSNPTNNVTYATFIRLETTGDVRVYTVSNATYPNNVTWTHFYDVFNNTRCQLPLHCGFYGKCDQEKKKAANCTCFAGFEFADALHHRSGCKLQNGSNEESQLPVDGSVCAISENQKVGFKTLQFVDYFFTHFTELQPKQLPNGSSCKEKCQRDCNCTAAFWNQTSFTCFLVRGPVGTIQTGTMDAYIKYLIMTNPAATSRRNWKVFGPVLAALAVSLVMAGIYLYQRRKALRKRSAELEQESLLLSLLGSDSPSRFTWKQMHEYTCGFSHNLGGGGFGCVFRGALPDGTAIAVKQLAEDRSYGQGNKEFISEVSILSRIHHAHLVRLIGFCLEGAHRLLVYEFMENGSLDRWLFKASRAAQKIEDGKKSNGRRETPLLPWKTRFQIALGTSKGLAYLHEECEERVIHMDFKPQNILLGRDFVPKISDFGMSRRIGREQTSVMTVMRGTPGYLAPEWLLDCAVTEKCDVYCFGIVLLEMVSGRRIRVKDVKALRRRGMGIRKKESANAMAGFLDDDLKYGRDGIAENGGVMVMEEEAARMVEIALLCVQTDPAKRPTMSCVALMLEGKVEVQQRDSSLMDEDDADDDDDEDEDDEEDEEENGYGGRELQGGLMRHQTAVRLARMMSKSLGSFSAARDGSGSFSMTSNNMWWSSSSSHSSSTVNSLRKYATNAPTNHHHQNNNNDTRSSGNQKGKPHVKEEDGAITESSTLLNHWSTNV